MREKRSNPRRGGAEMEAFEQRVLLSGYALTTLATIPAVQPVNSVSPLNLAEDSSGDFFAVGRSGGANSDGELFEAVNGSSTASVLASFGDATPFPSSQLVVDHAGNIYGLAYGAIYEYVKSSGNIISLASPGGTAGLNLVMDSAGDLFGVTQNGGTYSDGTVFELLAGGAHHHHACQLQRKQWKDPHRLHRPRRRRKPIWHDQRRGGESTWRSVRGGPRERRHHGPGKF